MRHLLNRLHRYRLRVVDAFYAQENGAFLLLEDGTNIIAE